MVANLDPHYFGKLDPDPHWSEKLDPEPLIEMEPWMPKNTHNGDVEARNGALEGL
jgi:hypothetical protein